MTDLVLVTGATGYVASHIIKCLVDKGYRVRGTVRKLSDKRHEDLHEACGDNDRTKIEFVEVDLESASELWDVAVKDCTACIHTAGPVKLTVKDVQKELLDPTLRGVANVFGACARSGTVKRVVYTSSASTLSDGFEKWKKHVYNSSDWNERSSRTHNPYAFAKTMGERAALEFVKGDKSFALADVLPYTVVGPLLLKFQKLAEAMDRPLRGALDGEMYMIDYFFGLSDVRDVALVHVAAMENLPLDANTQTEVPRYIVWNGVDSYKEIIRVLAATLPERKKKLPKGMILPDFFVLAWMKMTMPPGIYSYVKSNIGRKPRCDVTNIERDLQVSLRPCEEIIRDCALFLKESGRLKKMH